MKGFTRRRFIKCCAYAGAGAVLRPGLVSAESVKEEKQKEKLARYHFNFSSPYYTAMHPTTPHAHAEIKQVVERYTRNKVFVKIHDGGSMGIGSSLANSVRFNESQGALISVSNISPMINEFDILNIPFWSAGDAEYIRLFNSQLWKQYVVSKAAAFNIKVLCSGCQNRIFHPIKYRDTINVLPSFSRSHPCNNLGAIGYHLPGMKASLTSRYSLNNHPCILIY